MTKSDQRKKYNFSHEKTHFYKPMLQDLFELYIVGEPCEAEAWALCSKLEKKNCDINYNNSKTINLMRALRWRKCVFLFRIRLCRKSMSKVLGQFACWSWFMSQLHIHTKGPIIYLFDGRSPSRHKQSFLI